MFHKIVDELICILTENSDGNKTVVKTKTTHNPCGHNPLEGPQDKELGFKDYIIEKEQKKRRVTWAVVLYTSSTFCRR